MAVDNASLIPDSAAWAPSEEEQSVQNIGRAKGSVFLATLSFFYLGLTYLITPVTATPEASNLRAILACILCCGMLLEMFVDYCKMPAPKKEDEVFVVIQTGGKPAFLTFWILTVQTIYTIAVAVSEISLLTSRPLVALLSVNYTVSIYVDTLGVVLTLLFLKFNWYEAKWQAMRHTWEKRGVPFGTYTLLGHLPSLPVGVFDLLLKDRGYLALCSLSWAHNLLVAIIFSTLYFTWIHVLWAASGYKCWPYPFLHEFDTCTKRCVFLLAIILGVAIVMSTLTLLSWSSPW